MCASRWLPAVLVLLCVPALWAADPDADRVLVDKVNDAVKKGKSYLLSNVTGRDNWETLADAPAGASTSLVMLALLSSGVKPNDPVIQNGVKYLRGIQPHFTYAVGLQTMALAAVGDPQDKPQIQTNVDWLLKTCIEKDGNKLGWGYSAGYPSADFSNTQYALLGLHEAFQAGLKIKREDLEWIQNLYLNAQSNDGGWSYKPGTGKTMTMTTAGACGLLITGMDLSVGREAIRGGKVVGCGEYKEQENLARALKWIGDRFPTDPAEIPHRICDDRQQFVYYALYGIERLGRLSGQRFIGGKDWYRIGCEFLVGAQDRNGSWSAPGPGAQNHAIVCTSFALLFLAKGRTPVLISKLAHGEDTGGPDWNRDPHDLRNLVEFTRKQLFAGQLLAWQVFDPRFVKGDDDETVKRLAEELLQTPIVYITGHDDPHLITSNNELTRNGKILKQYVENGGFVYVEACCGSERFNRNFRDSVRKLFPDSHGLQPLDETHAVWTASAKWPSSPKDFRLWGVQLGCRTPLIYSENNFLCCQWQINDVDGAGLRAFRMGANIIAYATGLTPPPERGTQMHVTDTDKGKSPPPGSFRVGQIKHGKDWHPAHNAMRNLMLALRAAGIKDVDIVTQPIEISEPDDMTDYKFLYMHGRTEIQPYTEEAYGQLRFNLEHHGMLFADACCGSAVFDESFRKFIKQVFPDRKLEPIPLDDHLYSAKLNGQKIERVGCRRTKDKAPDATYPQVEPQLEGIRIGGRWVVIYSKYDIGCALEKHRTSDCLGHDHESAKRLAMAVALYVLRP